MHVQTGGVRKFDLHEFTFACPMTMPTDRGGRYWVAGMILTVMTGEGGNLPQALDLSAGDIDVVMQRGDAWLESRGESCCRNDSIQELAREIFRSPPCFVGDTGVNVRL